MFLLILAKMLNAGAASAQALFYQGKTIQEGHRTAADMVVRMKKVFGD